MKNWLICIECSSAVAVMVPVALAPWGVVIFWAGELARRSGPRQVPVWWVVEFVISLLPVVSISSVVPWVSRFIAVAVRMIVRLTLIWMGRPLHLHLVLALMPVRMMGHLPLKPEVSTRAVPLLLVVSLHELASKPIPVQMRFRLVILIGKLLEILMALTSLE